MPALLACCALSVTACGEDAATPKGPAPGGTTLERLEAVTISGEVGAEPEVTWNGSMSAGKVETETITEGDGDVVEADDEVLVHIWIGNGFVRETAYNTYEEKRPELLTIGDDLSPFLKGVKGAKVGSRLAVTSSAEEAFGAAGNSRLGIANKDTVLTIIDVVSEVRDQPEGEEQTPPAWMPKPEVTDGVIRKFDFSGTPAPTGVLRKFQLIKGDGPRVKKGQTIAVRYLGQAVGEDKPFDENFGEKGDGKVATFSIGTGAVIKGWDQGLDGMPVGSRVVLEIPPDLAYGKEGQPDAGIPKDATLVFVVDILGAA